MGKPSLPLQQVKQKAKTPEKAVESVGNTRRISPKACIIGDYLNG